MEVVSDLLVPSPARLSVCSRDIDEARSIAGDVYYPHEILVLGERRDFSMRVDATRLGPITVGWLSYNTEVQISTEELDSAYQVNVPVHGQLKTASGASRAIATRSTGAVYRCDRPTLMHGWADGRCRMLTVKINRLALEQQLALLLNRLIEKPIEFALPLDLTRRRARHWWSFVRTLTYQSRQPDALSRHPLMVKTLTQGIMTGLLVASPHDYSAELDAPGTVVGPATIRRAVDYIEANLTSPLDVSTIAAHVGLGVRSLQHGFQTAVGTTPTGYVRQARLRSARRDLLAADPTVTGVAEIAHRWGFAHLGRFAGWYRKEFGQSPSQTLTLPSG
jgi:AraC-like DNA-binding protein